MISPLVKKAAEHFGCKPEQIFFGSATDRTTHRYRRGWFYGDKNSGNIHHFQAYSFSDWQQMPAWAMKKLFGRDAF